MSPSGRFQPGFPIEAVIRIVFGDRIHLRQSGRRRADVDLASNDIGDQRGAVFAEKRDLPQRTLDSRLKGPTLDIRSSTIASCSAMLGSANLNPLICSGLK